jgi:hypothetical protein
MDPDGADQHCCWKPHKCVPLHHIQSRKWHLRQGHEIQEDIAMNAKFRTFVDSAESQLNRLMNSPPAERSSIPNKGGIYLFSDGSRHLYVGRAKDLRRRINGHSRPSSKDAPLAFKLAREQTNRRHATYKSQGSRAELLDDPLFYSAYSAAKETIRNFNVRFIIEEDPVHQALLEIYVAIALETPYNDFETH